MAGMTVVNVEDPYPSGLRGGDIEVDTATGTGTDSTTIRAAVADRQIHILAGFVTMTGAGTLDIYSDTTKIGSIELPGAGTKPLPPCYTAAGEALKMANPDGATIFIWCMSQAVASGAYAPLTG